MGRSKLKAALKAEKGIDIKKLKEKRRVKKISKVKAQKAGPRGVAKKIPGDDEEHNEDEDDESDEDYEEEDAADLGAEEGESDGGSDSDEDEDEEENQIDLAALDESSDDSSVDFEEKIVRPKKPKQSQANGAGAPSPKDSKKKKAAETEDEDDDEEDEEDEEIDWADLPPEEREDLVPRTRININNTVGLLATLKRFAITTDDSVPFASHQSLSSQKPTAEVIGDDLQDDIKRELAFYAQALEAGKRGRTLLKAEGVPFSRPTDYFAEMVKDDGHMEKVKAKLIEEASSKKASAEARKLRELKKFGKQVQVAKLQERAKEKRETLDKIKNLKRKRSETGGAELGTTEADLFDVGVDNELKSYKGGKGASAGAGNGKRQKKNEKYGFGGKKKHAKSGDAVSSGDLSGFSAKRMKTGDKGKMPKTARLGKSRRKAGAAKR